MKILQKTNLIFATAYPRIRQAEPIETSNDLLATHYAFMVIEWRFMDSDCSFF